MNGPTVQVAEGAEGARVSLLADRVIIERSGFFASVRQGSRVEVALSDIVDVLVSSPPALLRGTFVIVCDGENANSGFASNNTNPRAVYFDRKDQPSFERLRSAILGNVANTSPSPLGDLVGWAPPSPELLVLTARPQGPGIADLAVDLEERVIVHSLEASPGGSQLPVTLRPATTADTLLNDLLRSRPTAVHFSGHGLVEGLIIETVGRGAALASGEALMRLCSLEEVADALRLLVLNACLTAQQAQYLATRVPAVIGTLDNVLDAAAVAFSRGFYSGQGHGMSVASSFAAGVAQVSLEAGEAEAQKYALFRRADADPSSWGLL